MPQSPITPCPFSCGPCTQLDLWCETALGSCTHPFSSRLRLFRGFHPATTACTHTNDPLYTSFFLFWKTALTNIQPFLQAANLTVILSSSLSLNSQKPCIYTLSLLLQQAPWLCPVLCISRTLALDKDSIFLLDYYAGFLPGISASCLAHSNHRKLFWAMSHIRS